MFIMCLYQCLLITCGQSINQLKKIEAYRLKLLINNILKYIMRIKLKILTKDYKN